MAKRENRKKKREEELKALIHQREMQFRKRGILSIVVIVVCAVAMYLIDAKAAETNWGQTLILALSCVVILAFIFSVVNSLRRMRQMRDEKNQ